MKQNVYWWHGWEEVARLVIVTAIAYFVQIAPTLVEDFSNAIDQRKFVISLVVAGAQFILARVLAWLSEPPKTSRIP